MRTDGLADVYSLREVALAASVSAAQAQAVAGSDRMLSARDAVRLGRTLIARQREGLFISPALLFSTVSDARTFKRPALPLAMSASLHAALFGAVIVILGFRANAAVSQLDDEARPAHLIFLAAPGPGGGGGGGGGGQTDKLLPPRAEKPGRDPIASPVAV